MGHKQTKHGSHRSHFQTIFLFVNEANSHDQVEPVEKSEKVMVKMWNSWLCRFLLIRLDFQPDLMRTCKSFMRILYEFVFVPMWFVLEMKKSEKIWKILKKYASIKVTINIIIQSVGSKQIIQKCINKMYKFTPISHKFART